ncbi:uncharacterized protein UMAG_00055 [Mycosarcoma maydis]|uniref:Uncharacterized protein n=1 Tax=Mycosarcoma maydis TaxID=5270 RepID=A0A0D1CZD0_MYCMD|nr:uncharacterized protein UMAG_00055 [Ustilago maydis 521]KIS71613.1 hypothetical protein UMAG_00055 [Ustilago maydis 521]|eukprot:XP_011386028.1 hypothetical protein UMAG_00055 [Ustilago maydis 521]
MLGVPATSRVTSSSFYHRPNGLSVSDVDLDIEGAGGGRIDELYDAGLPWPLERSARQTSWSAKGPAEYIPRLPLFKSLYCHLNWARAGWWDGNRWSEALNLIASSREIRNGVLKGLVLSGTISAVVFFFELAFFPKVLFQQTHDQHVQGVVESGSIVGGLGNVFWLYPLIGGSYLLASSWTSDIANAAYKLRHGHVRRLTLSNPSLPPGTSRRMLQESYRMILIVNYTIFYLLLGRIPYLGRPLSFLFMCLVDGYYCFEQAWISRGWSLDRRMRYCEERWSYFVAFGLPSTAVSFFHPSGLLNLMLFMLVFPFCTVLAMLADPQPRISASGTLAASSNGFGVAGGHVYANGPLHRLVPSRLPIFWPTVKLHRLVLQLLPSLADVPLAPSAQAFERTANMYGRTTDVSGAGGFSVNGGFGGFGTGGKRAADVVGGIFNNGSRSNLNSGRNSPSPWPAYGAVPRSSHEVSSREACQHLDSGSDVPVSGGSATGTYNATGQIMYSRASAAPPPPKAPLGPPPKGPVAYHRKAD